MADAGSSNSAAEGVVPLFDIIETHLEILPALREVMPSRHAKAYLLSDRGLEIDSSFLDHTIYVPSDLDNFDHRKHAALIIEDIDAVWFNGLATRYAESLDVKFLAQHVLRLGELNATYEIHDGLEDGYRALVARVDAELSQRLSQTTVRRHCGHIDGHVYRSMMNGFGISLQGERSVSVGMGYRIEERVVVSYPPELPKVYKTSTRLSYCRLKENLMLVLVDAGPDTHGTLEIIRGSELLPADLSGFVTPLDFVRNVFRHYSIESIFRLPVANHFSCMLATSAYEDLVTNLEVEFLRRRQLATKVQTDNERAFLMLTNLRRDLTNTHERMARTSSLVDFVLALTQSDALRAQEPPARHMTVTSGHGMNCLGDGIAPTASPAAGSRKRKTADPSKLSETFSDLDARLRATIAALNEEIQIVIGSVQIQDAKAMKRQADLTMQLTESTMRQTEVSVRQTRWTVALAVLAALYLPMTLVTGIFGMNIKEVTGGEGPNWWWVIVAWAVTMGITVGSIARYALVEWQWYRKGLHEPKVATNQDSTDGSSKARDQGVVNSTSNEADDVGCLSLPRGRHSWRKTPQNARHDGARSTV